MGLRVDHLVRRQFPGASTVTNMTAKTVPRKTLITSALGLPFICIHSGPGSRNLRGLVRNRLHPKVGIIIIRSLVSANKDDLGTIRTVHGGNYRMMNVVTTCACKFSMTGRTFGATGMRLIALAGCRTMIRRTIHVNCVGARSISMLGR